jgi:hypothetical protein
MKWEMKNKLWVLVGNGARWVANGCVRSVFPERRRTFRMARRCRNGLDSSIKSKHSTSSVPLCNQVYTTQAGTLARTNRKDSVILSAVRSAKKPLSNCKGGSDGHC